MLVSLGDDSLSIDVYFNFWLRFIFLRACAAANRAQNSNFAFLQSHALVFGLFQIPLRLTLFSTNCDLSELETK